MNKKLLHFLLTFSLCLFALSCKSQKDPGGFETTESGILFKFIERNDSAQKVAAGMFIDFHLIRKNAADSIVEDRVYDSQPFPEDTTAGTPLEAFRMMAAGDSAVFRFSTDSLLNQTKKTIQSRIDMFRLQMEQQMAQAPNDSVKNGLKTKMEGQIKFMEGQMNQPNPELPPGKFLEFQIRLKSVKTKEQVQKEQEESLKKQKDTDKKTIEDYIADKKLEAKSTESGLYYVIKEAGSGDKPTAGQTVKVNYTGMLVSGKVFDTSLEDVAKANNIFREGRPYQPLEFPIGRRQVIQGWDEGIGLLNPGSKATLLVPSHLGYGQRGAGQDIPPNSVLIFEVELLEVK